MTICWDYLEGVRLNRKGNFCKGNTVYYYVDECANCGTSFLSEKRHGGLSRCCCTRCDRVGKKHTMETKQKISKSKTGQGHTIETRLKMVKYRTGKTLSTETRSRIADTKFGEKNPNFKGGVMKLNIALYDTYAHQLSGFGIEEVRGYMVSIGGIVYKTLQVRCHNSDCMVWFKPTLSQVSTRLRVISGRVGGANDFYCSEECKLSCSTYGQKLYPKEQNPNNPNKKELPYTKPEYDLYRQTVLEREDYLCEYCGVPATCVHHEQTQKEQPMLALDPDYGHACCDPCHYEYGHKTGTECSTGNLANKVC